MIRHALAPGGEVVLRGPPLRVRAKVVGVRAAADLHGDAARPRPLEHHLDLVPPLPEGAVEEAGGDEHRGRAVELREDRSGHRNLLRVPIVQGEGRSQFGAGRARLELAEHLPEGHQSVPPAPQEREGATQLCGVGAADS